LERGAPRAYYLLFGEETYLVERALALLRRRLAGERAGAVRTLWGDQQGEEVPGAIAELGAPTLFGATYVLVVRHADALGEDVQARVLEALPALGSGGSLILVARAADQRRKLFAACLRAGAGFGFPLLADVRVAATWVVRLARERGYEIAPAAVEEVVERSGRDVGILAGELDKLALHVGAGRRIDVAHVRAVVAGVRGHEVQEFTDRLARGDVAGAARILRLLLAEGEPPIRLVAFVAANLRRALQVAELVEAGAGADEIGRRLGMPPWLVKRNLGRGRTKDLVRALLVLRRLDLRLKSTRVAEAAFDAALLEIARG